MEINFVFLYTISFWKTEFGQLNSRITTFLTN